MEQNHYILTLSVLKRTLKVWVESDEPSVSLTDDEAKVLFDLVSKELKTFSREELISCFFTTLNECIERACGE